jgi:hypothetical protein
MGVRKSPQKAGDVAKIVRPALDPEHKLGPLNKPRIYFLCGPDLNRIGVEQMSSHAWPSTSHRVRFVSPRDLLLDHRSDATSNKIAWSQHVSIPIVHVPLLPPAPRLDMALPAFTRATNATWMENHSLIYDWNPTASLQTWRSATRLLRGGRQLQFRATRLFVFLEESGPVLYSIWHVRVVVRATQCLRYFARSGTFCHRPK